MASERSTRSPLTRSRLVTELLANRNCRKNFYFVPVIHIVYMYAFTKQSEFSFLPMKFQRARPSQTTRPSPSQRSRHRAVAHVRSRAPVAHIAWTPPRVHHARSSPTRTFAFRTRGVLRAVVSLGKIRVFVRTPSAARQPRERRRRAPRDDHDDPLGSLCGQLTPA